MKWLKLILTVLLMLPHLGCASLGVGPAGHKASSTRSKNNEGHKRREAARRNQDSPDSVLIGSSRIHAEQFLSDNAKICNEKNSTLTPEAYALFIQRLAAQWLNDAISELLLYEHASDKLPEKANEQIDGYVDAEIRKIVTVSHGGSQRTFERQLAADGETIEHVREHIRRQIVISSFVDTNIKTNTAEPTRAELWQQFQDTQQQYVRPPRRRMSLIDIRFLSFLPQDVDSPTRDQYETAKNKAREVVATITSQLAAGTPFDEIAKDESHGLHAVDGGSWGWVTPGSVRERYEPAVAALYSLKVDAMSSPIEVADGYLFVRCDEIDPGYTPTFAEVQVELTSQHLRESYNRNLMTLVNELREKANLNSQQLDSFHQYIVEQELARVSVRTNPSK